jgi:hypothetical protein
MAAAKIKEEVDGVGSGVHALTRGSRGGGITTHIDGPVYI